MTPFDLDAVCGEALFRLFMKIDAMADYHIAQARSLTYYRRSVGQRLRRQRERTWTTKR